MDGFASLEEVADAIAAYIPHRPRPRTCPGCARTCASGDGRWHWHWDPRFIAGRTGIDGQEGLVDHDRLRRGGGARRRSRRCSCAGRRATSSARRACASCSELVPHAEVVDVAGAGHMVAGDRNDAFNDAVVEFIERAALAESP